MEDPGEAIERAARRHRQESLAASTRADVEASAAQAALARDQRSYAESLITNALSESGGGASITVSIWIACAALSSAAAVAWRPRSDDLQIVYYFSLSLAWFGLSFLLTLQSKRARAAARRRRLTRIGRGFDVPRYLQQLAEQRRTAHLVITLDFARPWQPKEAESALDAMQTWLPSLPRAQWIAADHGATLRMDSGELETVSWYHPKGAAAIAYFSNAAPHACLLEILDKVLPKLDAANQVTRINVDVTGVVLGYEVDA